jgi:hypothetical protein
VYIPLSKDKITPDTTYRKRIKEKKRQSDRGGIGRNKEREKSKKEARRHIARDRTSKK